MKTLKNIPIVILLGLFFFSFQACSDELTIEMPRGPEGAQGSSAYEVWVEAVEDGTIEWDKNRTDINNFFLYLKGQDGKDGQNGTDGVNGQSAYELWIQEVKKGIKDPHNIDQQWSKNKINIQDFWYFLTGAKGQDGNIPTIGSNGNWYINDKDTGIPAKGKDGSNGSNGSNGTDGKDGSVITIGSNGNWYINGIDTGVSSKGKDGTNGSNGSNGTDGKNGSVITIGSNENWYIDGVDTKVPTKGKDGTNGSNGTDGTNGSNGSNGKDGSVITIGSNGNWYIDGVDTKIPAKGKDGTNGSNGTDGTNGSNGSNGTDGKDGSVITIGSNGNWYIDSIDTGVSAKGKDGKDGSIVTIGNNGNWYIDGTDTGVTAFGKNGTDGSNGSNGSNGTNGLSAYELWVQEVAKGLEDPHNPGKLWAKNKISTADFWDFLKGADGQDGKDGEAGGETGQPGGDIVLVAGKANVIPQYVNQAYNEFVRWEDGGVGYIVYDDAGNPAIEARVSGLPGVKDPTKVYVADYNGFFSVPKEDLPENEDVSKRRGATTFVRYMKSTGGLASETSAPNTYVPNRMYIRLKLKNDPIIDGAVMKFSPMVERKTDGGDWKIIPSYLGDLKQNLKAYSLGNLNDPMSYDKYSVIFTAADPTIDISSNIATLKINRLKKETSYYPIPDDKWDGLEHYFTLVLESYYGETPQMEAIVKMAPIQAMPMIKNIKAFGYDTGGGYFKRIEGELDIAGASIDNSLLFKSTLKKETKTSGGESYTYYSPEVDSSDAYNNAKQFTVRFRVSGNSAFDSKPSIGAPQFSFTTPYIESSVILECTSSYFYPLNTIGYLRFGTDTNLSTLTVVKRNDAHYVFPNIPVQYTAE